MSDIGRSDLVGSRAIVVVHGFNALLLTRMLWMGWHNGGVRVSYLSDLIVIALLAICVIVHIFRWRVLSKQEVGTTYVTKVSLASALRSTARTLYAAVPYMIRPVPSDALIDKCAANALGDSGSLAIGNRIDLMFKIWDIDGIILAHIGIAILLSAVLYWGGLPSILQPLERIWFVPPLLMYFSGGLLVYSVATVAFLMMSNEHRRK